MPWIELELSSTKSLSCYSFSCISENEYPLRRIILDCGANSKPVSFEERLRHKYLQYCCEVFALRFGICLFRHTQGSPQVSSSLLVSFRCLFVITQLGRFMYLYWAWKKLSTYCSARNVKKSSSSKSFFTENTYWMVRAPNYLSWCCKTFGSRLKRRNEIRSKLTI